MGEPPGDEELLARRAVDRVRAIARDAGIPERLRDVGVKEGQLAEIADRAFEDASHLGNPRAVTRADLETLARAAF
jgi:alcohol dehydrogenase class IV